MGFVVKINQTYAHHEPMTFDERATADVATKGAALFLGRPIEQGPFTLEQQRRADTLEAARQAEEAQAKIASEANREREWVQAARRARGSNLEDSGAKQPADVMELLLSRTLQDGGNVSKVREWLQDKGSRPWLILSGSTGRGKTVAALDAIGEAGGVFVRARELARAFSARWGEDHDFQEKCYNTRLLVIDDVGRETDHAQFAGFLEDLIDERPHARYRTIVTTNLDAKQFAATYADERLRSRLSKLATFHADSGEDMRRVKR